jgi:oxygen-independent coproporphyrinogen-3 oxidase
MSSEIKIRANEWKEPISSIYFGGGTPSVLEEADLNSLFNSIKEHYDLSLLDEITLECNPEDLLDDKLEFWRKNGINRLSIGNQSFQNSILKEINRQHTSQEAIRGIKKAREHGYSAISIDVIMGLPGLNSKLLHDDLEQLLLLKPEHVSAYQLSVEQKTTLAHQIQTGQVTIPNETEVNDHFLLTDQILTNAGYEHYEISNYALAGFEAKHNSTYWSGQSYLGIGPAAHSYRNGIRSWNVSNNNTYIKAINSNQAFYESEVLSKKDQYNETIMTSLRIKKGLDIAELKKSFPSYYSDELEENIDLWLANKLAIRNKGRIQLTLAGWLISDKLTSDVFVI